MKRILLLASANGLAVCERKGDGWQLSRFGLEGQSLTSVIAREGVILTGSSEGIYRSQDLGMTWGEANAGLAIRHVRWLAFHPQISDFEFAGTEPAGIFVSRDGGAAWRECPEVARLRERYSWFLPYSPEAGCVRGFAFQGERAYAAVEVGGVLVSQDTGATWRMAQDDRALERQSPGGFVHSDVHSVTVPLHAPDVVYAATGGGLYHSGDGGKVWERFYRCYCRAVWVDPVDPSRLLLGPADFVDRNGRIELSLDGGQTWSPAGEGSGAPWARHMVERFAQVGDELFAVLSNGELLVASIHSPMHPPLSWRRAVPPVSGVTCVTAMDIA